MKEMKRVFHIRWLLSAAMLLLLNAFLIINNNKEDASISQAYDEMIRLAMENKEGSVSNREAATLAWNQYFEEHCITNEESGEAALIAKEAREMLMTEADYIDQFEASVQEKMETAEILAKSGIYAVRSYEYQNLLKTQEDLSHIINLEVTVSNGIWLDRLYHHSYIPVLVEILLFITIYNFFLEKKTGLYYIIHSAGNGRARLFFTRCGILFLQAFLTSGLFYIESAVLLLRIHGGAEGIRFAAASDSGFLLTGASLTRIEFVGMLIFMSAVSAAVLALLLWLVLSFFKNVNIGIFVYLMLCAADVLMYMLISPKTVLRAAHFLNVYYLLFPNKALVYYNWGYSFGIISLTESTLVLAAVSGIGVLLTNAFINVNGYYSGKENILEKGINRIMEAFVWTLGKLPGIFTEIYKVVISQKAGIVLLMLLYVAGRIQIGSGVLYSPNMSYLAGYYEDAAGLSYGAELESVYNAYLEEYELFVDNFDKSSETADSILEYRSSLIKAIRENVDYMKQMSDKGIKAQVLKPYEYMAAFGEAEGENQKLLALLNVLAAIVISCGFISYEKEMKIHKLALAYRNRRKWLIRKMMTQFLLIAVFEGITYGVYYHKLLEVYELADLSAPLKSLPAFVNYPFHPSIFGFIEIDLFFKFIVLACLSVIVGYVSIHIKYIYCLFAGMLIAIPQLLYLIGFEAMDKAAVGKYVAFLPCFWEGITATRICYLFIMIMIIIGNGLGIYILKGETVSR